MKHDENVTILRRGKSWKTWNLAEEEELQYIYPPCICPVCFGPDTEVVSADFKTDEGGIPLDTGHVSYGVRGIFSIKKVNANYRCNGCECYFSKWFIDSGDNVLVEPGEEKWYRKMKKDLSEDFAAAVIMTLISIFMTTSVICAMTVGKEQKLLNGSAEWWVILWAIGSALVDAFCGMGISLTFTCWRDSKKG